MTKSAALQYADRNIRVNAVAPGYVESGMVNKEELGDFYDGLVAKHPIGRLGKLEEIAHAIVFLVENDFMTGTTNDRISGWRLHSSIIRSLRQVMKGRPPAVRNTAGGLFSYKVSE